MSTSAEREITANVLDQVRGGPDPRAREISEALVKHLHAFVAEIEPSEEEWKAGIDFLTAVGHMCSATRQEFILLSDALGVSMLVDAINHRSVGAATESTVFGPFYVEAPIFANGDNIAGHLTGTPMFVGGTVTDTEGAPIRGASVDVWHSDHEGFYDLQKLDEGNGLAGRGRFFTDDEGRFELWTMRPTAYPIPNDGPVGKMLAAQGRHPYRPEHIHFMIGMPGYRTLVTHLFAEGGAYLDSDVVFGVKQSLITPFEAQVGGRTPDGREMTGDWVKLTHRFVLESVEAKAMTA